MNAQAKRSLKRVLMLLDMSKKATRRAKKILEGEEK